MDTKFSKNFKAPNQSREFKKKLKQAWEDYLAQNVDHEFGPEEMLLDHALDIEHCFSEEDHKDALVNHLEQEKSHYKAKVIKTLMFKNLSRRERQAIRLVYLEGQTQIEAARTLGVSRRSLRIYLERGIQKIKKLCEGKKELSQLDGYFESLIEKANILKNEPNYQHINRFPKREEIRD